MQAFDIPAGPWGLTLVALSSMVASYLVGFAVRWGLIRINMVDRPNDRSSHSAPTPRGGGIGIMAVIWGGFIVVVGGTAPPFAIGVLACSFVLAALSFVDDRVSLVWSIRMAVQFLASLAAVVMLYLIGPSSIAVNLRWWLSPILVLWLVGYANAFNFMDGINGLATFQALLTGVATALIALRSGLDFHDPAVVLSLVLAGAAAGFLPHNFPRARMFMGDVSSVPLGFLLAMLALWIASYRGWLLLIPLACLHVNYVLDTGLTLLRRVRRGEVVHQAHREHFYQRAVRAGVSHTAVTLWEAALQMAVGAVAIWSVGRPGSRFVLVGTVGFALVCWSAFLFWCERRFQMRAGS